MIEKKIITKLKNANRVCSDCGNKYGERPEGHLGTFNKAICDMCGEEKSCTEPRDFLYFKKTLNGI